MFKTSCAGRDYGSHNITKKRKEENKMKKKVLLASLLCSVSFCFSPVNVFAEDDSISQIENGDGVATFGDWYENEYVDDFGDSTGKEFVRERLRILLLRRRIWLSSYFLNLERNH